MGRRLTRKFVHSGHKHIIDILNTYIHENIEIKLIDVKSSILFTTTCAYIQF